MPANMPTVIAPMTANVDAALRPLGGLKFGTPLLTASTPVNAVQPWEKARSTSATASHPVACEAGSMPYEADSATGVSPAVARTAAQASIRNTIAMNPYVGIAKT